MTYPWNGHFPASLPGVTARGRWADTTDDQNLVIVFGEIVLVVMANAPARAVLPRRFEIEEICRFFAIGTVYTKTGFCRPSEAAQMAGFRVNQALQARKD
jgi:hypothetical protein